MAGPEMIRIGTLALVLGLSVAGHAALTTAPGPAGDSENAAPVLKAPAINPDATPGKGAPAVKPGNPLWGVPLSTLSFTRDRPIFSASRRPPPPPVVARPAVIPPQPLPPPAPERLQLSLIGTIAGEDGIAILLDQTTRTVIRLRIGEGHSGWILRAVDGRQVTLEKGRRTEVVAFPPR